MESARYSSSHMTDAVKTKGLRYSAVSVFNVVLGQGLLLVFINVFHWPDVLSNVLSACIAAGPAYYVTRRWVWNKMGKNEMGREILPFWLFAVLGLLLSSLAVWAVSGVDIKFIANVASLGAYGVVWVIKFFFLDAVSFGRPHLAADGASMTTDVIEDAAIIDDEPTP